MNVTNGSAVSVSATHPITIGVWYAMVMSCGFLFVQKLYFSR